MCFYRRLSYSCVEMRRQHRSSSDGKHSVFPSAARSSSPPRCTQTGRKDGRGGDVNDKHWVNEFKHLCLVAYLCVRLQRLTGESDVQVFSSGWRFERQEHDGRASLQCGRVREVKGQLNCPRLNLLRHER